MQRSTTCVKDELKKLFSQVEHNLNTVITLFSNIIRKKRNSAIDDKPRDALVLAFAANAMAWLAS